MSSVEFLTQTTINGDTHSEEIFFESLLFCGKKKGQGGWVNKSQVSLHVVNDLSWIQLGAAIFKRKLSYSCQSRHLVLISLFADLRG